jgi:hypothetical protein
MPDLPSRPAAPAEAASKCPATMCPLFAADGSPWTGEKDSECPHDHAKCGWWQGFGGKHCDASGAALTQVVELSVGGRPLVVGKAYADRSAKQTTYDCARAAECQWQRQATAATDGLCPPRYALAMGLDPRACAW